MTRSIVRMALVLILAIMAVPATAAEKSGNADFDRAFEYHCAGQLPEAIAAYRVVVAGCTDPTLVKRARFGIAACCFAQKDYEAAITAFLDCAGAYPEEPEGALAIVYAGNCRMDQRRFSDAEKLYQQALAVKQGPEETRAWIGWAHLGMGRFLTKSGRYQEALPYLESAIAEAPEPKVIVEAKLFKSECLNAFGAKEDAIRPLNDILGMNTAGPYPDAERTTWQYWATFDVSAISWEMGDKDAAIDLVSGIMFCYPNHECYDMAGGILASFLARSGRTDEAVTVLRSTLRADAPHAGQAEIRDCIARFYLEAGRYAEAAAAYGEVLRSGGTPLDLQAKAGYHLGICQQKLGNSDLATRCMTDVSSKYSDNVWARRARGALYVWSTYGAQAEIR